MIYVPDKRLTYIDKYLSTLNNIQMNSIIRPRRLRRTEAIREMVRENHLNPSDFIYPLFIHEKDYKEEISAMPGTFRWDMNGLSLIHI